MSAPAPTSARPEYLRTALTPRMLVLLVLLLGAAAVCVRLGMWQLDRAEIRGRDDAEARVAEAVQGAPVPLGEVLGPQQTFRGELVGRKVEVRGTFEDDELLVVDRALDGRTGYLVLSPLRVDGVAGADGRAPVLAVIRGWVATEDEASGVAAPVGPVTVTGYLQAGESAGDGGAGPGMTDSISPAVLVNRWGGPTYSGYLVVSEVEPAPGAVPQRLPLPTTSGGGLNVQNLAYALQWWIFGGFAVLLWGRIVRDTARDEWRTT
ncbi:SURF1 family protein [Cellulomonas bogoriensis]|uniref:SURF1-like protein n=1 Tax=Cellulomonas bogoriensis 69B4 = DSM 16987 TaxID=1386082 RepID=A0A0A0BYS4_9CELL|nr:SURF1 family protein [Cellulomonas bogoriensis]KGM13110.1 hypothetical protein N869_16205 [Cellulomonas bogoriensis 69B4 = DSM 16987]